MPLISSIERPPIGAANRARRGTCITDANRAHHSHSSPTDGSTTGTAAVTNEAGWFDVARRARGWPMPVVSRDGVRLYFEQGGRGEPALVFVPGWCCNASFYAPQVDHFSRSYAVTTIELRG